MTVSFDELSHNTRVWVYTANRLLTEQEVFFVQAQLVQFTTDWFSHGKPLKAAAAVIEQAIVVIAVENGWDEASGCSIDKSVGLIKSLEQALKVSFLDRMILLYKESVETPILFLGLNKLKTGLREGLYSTEALIINTQELVFEQVKKSPWQSIKDSWLVKSVVSVI